MKNKRKWIFASALALAGFVALQLSPQPGQDSATQTLTQTVVAIDFLTETPTIEGCAFIWAYQDAPELTEKLNAQIVALVPDASANVRYFGEDCVYADGHSTFSAFETDFYIRFKVADFSDNEAFGNWIAKGMGIVTQIPKEEIQGSFGFVEFWFQKSESEQLIVRVPIRKYLDEGHGLTGAALLDYFIERP